MSHFDLQALQSAKDQTEKAAIIAEAAFSLLPEATALVARRCVILHWFDQLLVETMLEDSELTLDEMRHAYELLATLPFIDSVPWGLTFQNVTREGLLKRYVTTQPELLQTAARLAAPAYEMQEEDKKSIAEAFYCYLVAGDQESATALQQALFVQASSNLDWQYVNNLLQLQAEAERLPFVRPLPRDERQLLLQGLVHRVQGKREAALLDYTQALDMNPTSILAYVSRGTTYIEQKSYDKALADYNTASRIDKNFAPTYLSRSLVYTKQGKYREALKENNKAVQLGLNTDMIYINKASILNELGQYEDALTACNAALQINQNAIEAYIWKGQALYGLENYNEALSVYEKALLLNPDAVDAYIGKGKALNGLQRYTEALEACNIAIKLNPNTADAYRVQAYAYRSLMQYELASEASRRANELDPIAEEERTHEDTITDKGKNKNTQNRKQRERSTVNNQKTISFLGNITRVFRPTQGIAQERAKTFKKGIENSLTVAIVGIIILAAIALFPTIRSTIRSTIGGNADANATATSVANTKADATATANANACATAQARVNATATAQATSGGLPNPYTHSGSLVLTDQLTCNNYSWDTGTNNHNASCLFTSQGFEVTQPADGFFHGCIAKNTDFTNFTYEVQMKMISGDYGGIIFCANKTQGTYYFFYIKPDRNYVLKTVSGDQFQGTLTSGSSSAIVTGLPSTNVLAVVVQDGNITLYVNEISIAHVSDTTYTHGQIGVFTGNDVNSAKTVFSHARVWQ